MSIIYVLIPLAILIVALAVVIFFWAVKNNQFDDLERQGHSILFDDDIAPKTTSIDNSPTPKDKMSVPSPQQNESKRD
ncbi:cbb3-type cytochrome oxidase assembly protein CcoS [Opacimonas viscosa]|uniref:Cbb3-type cytochrome oxidase assembly protein CcoS n=1 Tax=Opacimonas viscosa TaxID=2961944 RepID=A0AA42BK82_9ALTE|nr:cbb3-type cytochrome oxidase assembly protein CcoS [Opacimonas viscosa]MCP3427463.1 cbb3-type cytochrome oxidase assembly protein CcoS [Opacimonas viscosa]